MYFDCVQWEMTVLNGTKMAFDKIIIKIKIPQPLRANGCFRGEVSVGEKSNCFDRLILRQAFSFLSINTASLETLITFEPELNSNFKLSCNRIQ